jgi:uncharacterized protein (TIGR02145 family)
MKNGVKQKILPLLEMLVILALANCASDYEIQPETWEEFAIKRGLLSSDDSGNGSSSGDGNSSSSGGSSSSSAPYAPSSEVDSDIIFINNFAVSVGANKVTIGARINATKDNPVRKVEFIGISNWVLYEGNPISEITFTEQTAVPILNLSSKLEIDLTNASIPCGTHAFTLKACTIDACATKNEEFTKPESFCRSSGAIYGQDIFYGDELYKTVIIGDQVWMARNLNYEVEGSKCYNDEPAYCAKYGRLYNWAMAMNVCPDGWHLPTGEQWDALIMITGGTGMGGKNLKTTDDWNDYSGQSGNGTDIHGFAAMPGGGFFGRDGFNYIGQYGYWWSSDAEGERDEDDVYYYYVRYSDENARRGSAAKSAFYSVRCIKGAGIQTSSSSTPSSNSQLSSSSAGILSSSSKTYNDSDIVGCISSAGICISIEFGTCKIIGTTVKDSCP